MTAIRRPTRPRLNRAAIATGAAARWDRLHILEDTIDHACETAARRCRPHADNDDRTRWDRHAWHAYVDEALNQARLHGPQLALLRQDAERLEHLIACVS